MYTDLLVKFSAQEEYGLRCLLQIARAPEAFSTVPDLAKREGLTTAYVAKLLRVLLKAGFLKSIRGQKGGYRLAREAERMQIGEILEALGGRLYSEKFCRRYAGEKRTCVHDADCSIRSLWIFLDRSLQRALTKTTLADLVCSEREMTTWTRKNLDGAEEPGRSALPISR